jgi:hypothetical protein
MKKTGSLLLFFLILYATSCSDMNEVKSSEYGGNKKDITPMKTLKVDENSYVIGWQLEVKDGTNYRWINKQLVRKESNSIKKEIDEIEKDSIEIVKENEETVNPPAETERVNTTETSINLETTKESEPNEPTVVQRKIRGYQATRDLKTGEIITYPVYEDE